MLSPSVTARYIRIHPQSWFGHVSMRIELYGYSKGTLIVTRSFFRDKCSHADSKYILLIIIGNGKIINISNETDA